MVEALQILYDIYREFMSFVFNDMFIYTNVSFGWFVVALFVFGILIRNILTLPKSAPSPKASPKLSSHSSSKGGNDSE